MAYIDYAPSYGELTEFQEHTGQKLDELKVLVVVSSKSKLVLKDGSIYKTGHYLGELYEPLFVLMDFGLKEENIVFASIEGSKKPPIDKNSTHIRYPFFNRTFPFIGGSFNRIWPHGNDRDRALEMYENDRPSNISKPVKLADIVNSAAEDFDVVFFSRRPLPTY